ncbi:MAG: diacylglycerol kinase family lipid kinase [Myxococcales bacterium]|nr:diacylglycerol kinase family lipid kinase [Myxococcales bacterium]
MTPRTLVIVNPRSRAGATGRRWASVERKLRNALGSLEVEHTRGPRDAERLAREGVRAGVERIVIAGGDGTLNEVATGLLAADLGDRAELAILPLGTGGDFRRALGIPRDLDGAIASITASSARRIDAGRVRYLDHQGREATAWFLNVASAGISGLIVELVTRTTRIAGGTLAFLIATVWGILRFRAEPVRLRIDGECVHEGPLVLCAAANGRCFGGGMAVAPDARLDDGRLDVVWVPRLPKLRLLARLGLIYRGRHFEVPEIGHGSGRVVEMEAASGSVPLEIDGDPVGTLPVRIEIVPAALSVLGPTP